MNKCGPFFWHYGSVIYFVFVMLDVLWCFILYLLLRSVFFIMFCSFIFDTLDIGYVFNLFTKSLILDTYEYVHVGG
jgi:hypothetical protein